MFAIKILTVKRNEDSRTLNNMLRLLKWMLFSVLNGNVTGLL